MRLISTSRPLREELTRRIDRFMFWSFGLTVSVGALVVGALKLWS